MKNNLDNLKSQDQVDHNFTVDEAGEYITKMDPKPETVIDRMIQNANRPHIEMFKKQNNEIKDLD